MIPYQRIEPIIIKMFIEEHKVLHAFIKHINKKWFQDNMYAEIMDYVVKHYKEYRTPITRNVLEFTIEKNLNGNEDRLKDIQEKIDIVFDVKIEDSEDLFYENEVVKYLKDQAHVQIIMQYIDEIKKTHSSCNCVDDLIKISSISLDTKVGHDYFEDIDIHLKNLSNSEMRIPFYYDELDLVTNGGMSKLDKCLVVFAAGTHVGKSMILSNLAAKQLMYDKFCVIFTLEMSENVYAQRVDAHLTNININHIRHQTEKAKDSILKVQKDCPNAKLIIKEFSCGVASCMDVKAHVDLIVEKYGRRPDVIFIDYLTLLRPNGTQSTDNSYQKYKIVAEELRNLSFDCHCPVVTACQMNRTGSVTADAGMESVAESYGIAQTADFFATLYQAEGDREAEKINAAIKKNRLGGRIGSILDFHVNYETLTIDEPSKITVGEQNKLHDEIIGAKQTKQSETDNAPQTVEKKRGRKPA